mmetsp:Transcript_16953/g.41997  ORF Transcript_16953/g.41997 Transcript_16953/m.41997 type:complete len:394 (+) Transcript_16953:2399-3580(+)
MAIRTFASFAAALARKLRDASCERAPCVTSQPQQPRAKSATAGKPYRSAELAIPATALLKDELSQPIVRATKRKSNQPPERIFSSFSRTIAMACSRCASSRHQSKNAALNSGSSCTNSFSPSSSRVVFPATAIADSTLPYAGDCSSFSSKAASRRRQTRSCSDSCTRKNSSRWAPGARSDSDTCRISWATPGPSNAVPSEVWSRRLWYAGTTAPSSSCSSSFVDTSSSRPATANTASRNSRFVHRRTSSEENGLCSSAGNSISGNSNTRCSRSAHRSWSTARNSSSRVEYFPGSRSECRTTKLTFGSWLESFRSTLPAYRSRSRNAIFDVSTWRWRKNSDRPLKRLTNADSWSVASTSCSLPLSLPCRSKSSSVGPLIAASAAGAGLPLTPST